MENFKGILAGVNDLQMMGRAFRPLNNKQPAFIWNGSQYASAGSVKDINNLYETPIHLTTKKKKKYRSIDEPFEPSW